MPIRRTTSTSSTRSDNNVSRRPLTPSLSASHISKQAKKQKQKKKKNRFIYGVILILSSFVLLPILYLQLQLIHPTNKTKNTNHHSHHNYHDSPVNKKLKEFQQRQQQPKGKLKSVHTGNNNNNLPTLDENESSSQSSFSSSSSTSTWKDFHRPILTTYSEPLSTMKVSSVPFQRNTSSAMLHKREYPNVGKSCQTLMEDFPIDEYPMDDPYLPWIHDYFVSADATQIKFVAQNKRRCGPTSDDEDGDMETFLTKWNFHYALFQSIPIVVEESDGDGDAMNYRLAASRDEATHPFTRFQCRFHSSKDDSSFLTFSEYPFDYEYVHWRKTKKSIFVIEGDDSALNNKGMPNFWLSQLMFSCPIPREYQHQLEFRESNGNSSSNDDPVFYLDIIPIRTPVRSKVWLTVNQTGPDGFKTIDKMFDAPTAFGSQQYLPDVENSGRWANFPICPATTGQHPKPSPQQTVKDQDEDGKGLQDSSLGTNNDQNNSNKPYRLVGCTWTAASYTRRGDAVRVTDSAKRLEEWIRFHLMVGVQHLYVYDNSNYDNTTTTTKFELKEVTEKFPSHQVTYHRWPCQVCNNNRPAHANPGERSSQYAAEASCRERYGSTTEWMTFIDTDEYLIPMKPTADGEYKWDAVLDEMDEKGINILKFLSSRGKPRVDLMEELQDQSQCHANDDPNSRKKKDLLLPCTGPKPSETFLKVYNCDYIRPPKPSRFSRAMKQIYKPSYVLSHFVHYSTVTSDTAITYQEFMTSSRHRQKKHGQKKYIPYTRSHQFENQLPELFLDELSHGALIHARSILPHETMNRNSTCYIGSKQPCNVGFACDDSIKFIDAVHKDNVFQNPDGSYCNCWRNPVVDKILAPLLGKQFED